MTSPLRDSISRCNTDQYASPYEVRNHPEMRAIKKETEKIRPQDSLEISKENLRQEALKRLNHTSKSVVAQNGFIRIGKILFTGLTLPPYLFLYRIPKWVFFTIGPVIFNFFGKQVQKINLKPKEKVQLIINKIKLSWKKIEKKIKIKVVIENLFQNLSKNLETCRRQIVLFFSPIVRLTKSKLKEKTVHYRKGAIQKIKHIGNKLARFFEMGIGEGSKMLSSLKENIFSFFKNSALASNEKWQRFRGQAKENFSIIFHSLSNCRERGQILAFKGMNWLSKQKDKWAFIFHKKQERISAKYFQNVHPTVLKVADQLKSIFSALVRYINGKRQRFVSFVDLQLKRLHHFANKSDFLKHAYQYFPLFMRDRVKIILEKPLVQRGLRSLAKSFSFLCHQGWSFVLILSKGIKKLFLGAHYFTKMLLNYLRKGMELLISYILIGWKYVKKGVFFLVYQFLVLVIMTAILISWGLRGLNETSNAFLQKKL